MAGAIIQVYATTATRLPDLAVNDGNLIFVRDTRKVYLDYGGLRLDFTTIRVFQTDAERVGTLAPVEGFYYVEDTGVLWRYSSSWKQITPSNLTPIFFGKYEDFPPTGSSSMLYVDDAQTYRWDGAKYIVVANKTEWEEL